MRLKLFVLLLLLHTPLLAGATYAAEAPNDVTIEQVSVLLTKMRKTMQQIGEIDRLSEVGMPESDIKLMKTAIKIKIKKMTSEVVLLIGRL